MRYAILSDIHGNRQAWEEVLNDLVDWGVDATVCLGDIVGYGPMPEAVLESVCEYADDILIGNHDAVVGGRLNPDIFSDSARRLIDWTQSVLDDSAVRFLGELPSMIEADGFVMAHAEILDPEMFGYIENPTDARLNFEADNSELIFVGHTHFPEVFSMDTVNDTVQRTPPGDFILQDGFRYIVNIGSVGDPRDATADACYVVFDDELRSITYRRLPFDLDEYRADMAERRLEVKPYFMMCAERTSTTQAPPTTDWAMEMPPRARGTERRPAKVIRLSRSDGAMDAEQAAQADLARQIRLELAESMKRARVEAEEKRRAQAEATRLALQRKKDRAAALRKQKQEEQERIAEEARLRKIELLKVAKANEAKRRKQKERQTTAFVEALQRKKEAAKKVAAIKAWKREQEEAERKKKLAEARKELAKVAEERQKVREQHKAVEAAALREKMQLKKQLPKQPGRPKTPAPTPTPEASAIRPVLEPQEPVARPVLEPLMPTAVEYEEGPVETEDAHEIQEIVMRPTTGDVAPAQAVEPEPAPIIPATPDARKVSIAAAAAEKKERRRREYEEKRRKAREAIALKRELARRAREEADE